jgi:hypothetical protein
MLYVNANSTLHAKGPKMTKTIWAESTDGRAKVETDCTVSHGGQTFEADGATVSPERLIAYIGENHTVTTWKGEPIGTYQTVARWKTPRSYLSSTMEQVEIILNDGTIYTGRTGGIGLSVSARRKRQQRLTRRCYVDFLNR